MNQPLNRNRLALVGGVTFLSPKVAFPCALIRYRLLCKTLGRVLRRLNPGESAPSCAAVCRLGQTSAGPFFLYAVCVCVCVCYPGSAFYWTCRAFGAPYNLSKIRTRRLVTGLQRATSLFSLRSYRVALFFTDRGSSSKSRKKSHKTKTAK